MASSRRLPKIARFETAAMVGLALALMSAVVLGASPAASASAVTNVSVRPDRYWTATGVVVRSGDSITISATGLMHFGPAPIDRVAPAGLERRCPTPVRGLRWPAPNLTCRSLIARIGSSSPFEVGVRTTLRARVGGELSLGINDDLLRDDSGSWTAVVTIAPPATTTPAPVATKGTSKSSSSSSSLAVIAAIALVAAVALVAGLFVLAARRRRSPTTPMPVPAAAPEVVDADPVAPMPIVSTPDSPATDFDRAKGNIFEVVFADRDSLRVGYSYFPEGTLVHCRVTHNSTTAATGEFITDGGGSAPRYATVPLGADVTSTLEGVKVRFNWTIGDLLEYSATRDPSSS